MPAVSLSSAQCRSDSALGIRVWGDFSGTVQRAARSTPWKTVRVEAAVGPSKIHEPSRRARAVPAHDEAAHGERIHDEQGRVKTGSARGQCAAPARLHGRLVPSTRGVPNQAGRNRQEGRRESAMDVAARARR